MNLMQLLDRKVSEVEKPKPLPCGGYTFMITKYSTGTSQKTDTPFVEFELKPVSPEADVDMDEYAKVHNPTELTIKSTFWLTDTALWRLQDFLGKAGFDINEDKSFAEMLSEIAGHTVRGIVQHVNSKDGESVYLDIKKFLAAE